MPKTAIDSNLLVAYAVESDKYHRIAIPALEALIIEEESIVPAPVLVEVFALVSARADHESVVVIDRVIRGTFKIESLTETDMHRMSELLEKYADLELDYVDAAVIAVSERLNITRIATFDRRDFSVVRPAHAEYFELLP